MNSGVAPVSFRQRAANHFFRQFFAVKQLADSCREGLGIVLVHDMSPAAAAGAIGME